MPILLFKTLYHWREGRDQGGITDVLGDAPIPRILQCDGYSAYPSWAKARPHIRLMGCHAHVRRKFFEAKDQSPKLTSWLLRQLGHLYRIEKELRDQLPDPRCALPSGPHKAVPSTSGSSK